MNAPGSVLSPGRSNSAIARAAPRARFVGELGRPSTPDDARPARAAPGRCHG